MSNDPNAARLRRIVISKTTKATFLPGLPKDVAIKGQKLRTFLVDLYYDNILTIVSDACTINVLLALVTCVVGYVHK